MKFELCVKFENKYLCDCYLLLHCSVKQILVNCLIVSRGMMNAHRESQQRRRVSVVSYIHTTSGRLRRPPRVERHAPVRPSRQCSPSSGRANHHLPTVLSEGDSEPGEAGAIITSRSCTCSSTSTDRRCLSDKSKSKDSVEAAASTNKHMKKTQVSKIVAPVVAEDLAACLPPGDPRPYDRSRYTQNKAVDDVLSYDVLPAEMLPFTAKRHRAYDKSKYYETTPREVPISRDQMALQLRQELEQWRRSQASSVQSLEEQYPQWADWRADILPQKRPSSAPEVRTTFRDGSGQAEASDIKKKDELGTPSSPRQVGASQSEPSLSQRSSDDAAGNPAQDAEQRAAQPCPSCRHVTFQLPNEPPPPPAARCLSAAALDHAQAALRAQRQQLRALEAVRALRPPAPPLSPPTPPPEAEEAARRLEAARSQLGAVRGSLEAAPVLSCRSVTTNTNTSSSSSSAAEPPLTASKRVQADPKGRSAPSARKPQKLQKNEPSNLKKTSSSQTDVLVRPGASGVPSSSRSRVGRAVLEAAEQVSASRESVAALRTLLMPRPKQRSQRPPRLQHQPHCKYYQGEPQGNAAIFDVRSQQEEAEAAARRSRLQLQRLPALTIRRQLQVQWGPTVSLPQPGETPPPGPPPGHNVRLFEVRHGDASAGQTAAAPTAGQAFVVHKHADAPNRQQPLTQPFKPVDVTPLREVPSEQPQPAAEVPPQPLVIPAPPPRPPSPPPPQSGIPVRQQTPATRPSSRGRPSRQAATRSTRDQTLTVTFSSARHAHLSGSRGAARSRAAPSASPGARPRIAARSPPRRSSSRRGSPSRRVSPGAVAGAAAARGPVFGPSTPPPPATAARSSRRAPARLDITSTSLPATVPGGLEPGGQSDALFRELSAAAEARRITSIPTTAVGEFVDGPLNVEQEGSPFGDTFAEDVVGMGLAARAETEIDGNGDGDADLWSAAQRIRRQQEVTDIEHRVLDLIGARVVAGLLNKDRKLEFENWGEYRMQQPSLSDEVGEHRVLGEGISLEETEIRTPINYDDYLDQEPADNEAEYNGSEKGDSADGGSPDYEDDFEEEEEEEANQESPPVSADTREEAPPDQKLASVPEIQVDSESPKDEKSGQATPVVEATPLGPEPAAPSPARSPSSPAHSPPSPGRFGTVRIRSRRTGSVTTVNLPLPLPLPLHHVPTPTPTPVSSPERSRPGSTRRVVTPERSPSPRRGDSGRVPTPPPSPEHSRDRVTMYKWRSRLEAPPAPPLTPPASPPPAPPGAFSFTPEATSPRGSPPLPDLASGGAVASDAPAEPPVSGRQSSRDVRATTEAPGVPAGYGRPLGVSLTSSSSLTYSSSVSSNPQVVSQDSLSWGEVRLQRDASSSADTQLSQGEVPARAVGEPAWLCSSLSEGEAVGLHRCSRQANAEPGRSIASSSAGAAVGRIENGGIRKDLSEGEISEGLVPALLPYGVSDDTDSTSVSDTT